MSKAQKGSYKAFALKAIPIALLVGGARVLRELTVFAGH